jgi:hypothetical protein
MRSVYLPLAPITGLLMKMYVPASYHAVLTKVAVYGGIAVLLAGLVSFIGDRLFGLHLTSAWMQVSTLFAALLLWGLLGLPQLTWVQRVLVSAGGLLLVLTAFDSFDGTQNIFVSPVTLLTAWGLIFVGQSSRVIQLHRERKPRHWFAILLGLAAALVYLSAAGYYLVRTVTVSPVELERHDLYGIALVLPTLIQYLGELGAFGQTLRGYVRVCSGCGLRNIRERQTCKRCGQLLGPITKVE